MEAMEPKRPDQPTYSEQQAKEILAQAMALPEQQGDGDNFSRAQLLEMAAELGISNDALQVAERQWLHRQESSQQHESKEADMKAFLRERRQGYKEHLGIFLIVHIFLILLNILTGGALWFLYSLVGWGMALALHTFVTLNENRPERIESEFEEWRTQRLERQSPTQLMS